MPRCEGFTLKGEPCSRNAKNGPPWLCHSHASATRPARRCRGYKKDGDRCSKKVRQGNICGTHIYQLPELIARHGKQLFSEDVNLQLEAQGLPAETTRSSRSAASAASAARADDALVAGMAALELKRQESGGEYEMKRLPDYDDLFAYEHSGRTIQDAFPGYDVRQIEKLRKNLTKSLKANKIDELKQIMDNNHIRDPNDQIELIKDLYPGYNYHAILSKVHGKF